MSSLDALMGRVSLILLRPKYPENIGAAARAAWAMGIGQLVVIGSPLSVQAQEQALKMATHHAAHLVTGIRYAAQLVEVLADFVVVVGATARRGRQRMAFVNPEGLAESLRPILVHGPVALLFGPEDTGLANHDLAACGLVVTIPTSISDHRGKLNCKRLQGTPAGVSPARLPARKRPVNYTSVCEQAAGQLSEDCEADGVPCDRLPTSDRLRSLNLAQAVMIISYALRQGLSQREEASASRLYQPRSASPEELAAMFAASRLACLSLDRVSGQGLAETRLRHLRQAVSRAQLSAKEAKLLKDFCCQLAELDDLQPIVSDTSPLLLAASKGVAAVHDEGDRS